MGRRAKAACESREGPHDSIVAEFVKASKVKVGSILKADGGFGCMKEGARRKVKKDEKLRKLYVRCGCGGGRHYLEGQLNVARCYVGFYAA